MKERLEEAESMGVRRMKAQVQAMEGRVASLEEQLDSATRYTHTDIHTHCTRTHTHTLHTHTHACMHKPIQKSAQTYAHARTLIDTHQKNLTEHCIYYYCPTSLPPPHPPQGACHCPPHSPSSGQETEGLDGVRGRREETGRELQSRGGRGLCLCGCGRGICFVGGASSCSLRIICVAVYTVCFIVVC